MKSEINNRNKFGKFTNMWKLKIIFLSKKWFIEEKKKKR